MSGISGIGSSPSSAFSSSLGSSSLPNGGLSSVGASLLTSGAAPNPVPTAAAPSPDTLSTYQSQFLSLQQYDDQELLYASFLDPSDALANADSVFAQAATLLGSPGHPGTLATGASPTIVGTPTSTSTTAPASTNSSSTSSASSALTNLPSIGSILAASDDEADQTLTAYANAPVGSSILDYQA